MSRERQAVEAPVIAYVTTCTLPSAETDTEQTIRSFEAMHRVDPRSVLVVPRTRAPAATQKAIEDFYQTEAGLPFRFYRGVGALRGEAERVLNLLLAVRHWAGRFAIVQTRSRGTVLLAVLMGQKVSFETYRKLPLTNPLFFSLLRRIARSQNLLGVTCHSMQARQSMIEAGFPAHKLGVFRNGYQPGLFDPPITRTKAREALGLPSEKRIITYTGNVQKGKGVETLLQLAAMRPGPLFTIVGGKTADLARIRRLVDQAGLGNVLLTGHQPPGKVAVHLRAADLLVIPPTDEPQQRYRRTLLPMKTFLYLGAGRPILAPETPDICEVLRHGENAWLVPPGNMEQAGTALDRLLSDSQLAEALALGAKRSAANFTWEHRASVLRDWLIERLDVAD